MRISDVAKEFGLSILSDSVGLFRIKRIILCVLMFDETSRRFGFKIANWQVHFFVEQFSVCDSFNLFSL